MLTVIILAAGEGKRMGTSVPKVLNPLGGRPLLDYVLDTARVLQPDGLVVVTSPLLTEKLSPDLSTVIQEQPLGTGHAVHTAVQSLPADQSGDVLVLYGDVPLITPEHLSPLLTAHAKKPGYYVMGAPMADPTGYGRLCVGEAYLDKIVEHKDASPAEQAITFCNTGVMHLPLSLLRTYLPALTSNNASKEYYLTDMVALARRDDVPVYAVAGDPICLQGVNTLVDLAQAEHALQQRWRHNFLLKGVRMPDPSSVHFSYDTVIGQEVVIGPQVVMGPQVQLEDGVTIRGQCHISQTHIKRGASIGPFAYLRQGVSVGEHATIGNFVELKKSTIGPKSKIKHLSYVGDTTVGEDSNIGAGTIICNYDGRKKAHTHIGNGVFVGSHTTLIAPVHVHDGAVVAGGTVVTDDVPEDALAIGRSFQTTRLKWASNRREKGQ